MINTTVLPQQVPPFPWNYREFGPHPQSVTLYRVPIPQSNRGYRDSARFP